MSERGQFWDGAIIAGGVLAAAMALRAYRGFDAVAGKPEQNRFTPAQARSTVSSAKAYLNAVNKILQPLARAHPQIGDV